MVKDYVTRNVVLAVAFILLVFAASCNGSLSQGSSANEASSAALTRPTAPQDAFSLQHVKCGDELEVTYLKQITKPEDTDLIGFIGYVKNTGTHSLLSVDVAVQLLSSNGEVLTESSPSSVPEHLDPGSGVGFQVELINRKPVFWQNAAVSCSIGKTQAPQASSQLKVDTTSFERTGDYYTIKGKIKNDGSSTVQRARVTVTLFDASDEPVSVFTISTMSEALPGGYTDFLMSVQANPILDSVVRHEVHVESLGSFEEVCVCCHVSSTLLSLVRHG